MERFSAWPFDVYAMSGLLNVLLHLLDLQTFHWLVLIASNLHSILCIRNCCCTVAYLLWSHCFFLSLHLDPKIYLCTACCSSIYIHWRIMLTDCIICYWSMILEESDSHFWFKFLMVEYISINLCTMHKNHDIYFLMILWHAYYHSNFHLLRSLVLLAFEYWLYYILECTCIYVNRKSLKCRCYEWFWSKFRYHIALVELYYIKVLYVFFLWILQYDGIWSYVF